MAVHALDPGQTRVHAPALPDTVLTFDDLPVGTRVTDQYQRLGVIFDQNRAPTIEQVGAGEAASGDQVASISEGQGCEFFVPLTKGRFSITRRFIRVEVGEFDDFLTEPIETGFILDAYDNYGTLVAESSITSTFAVGTGFHTTLDVHVPTATIASFE